MSVLCGHNAESTAETLERTTSKSATTFAEMLNVEGENTDANSHNQKLGVSNCFNRQRSISISANIDLHKTPRRGPEAFTFKVDRDAWNVGSANPQSSGSGFHTVRSTHMGLQRSSSSA